MKHTDLWLVPKVVIDGLKDQGIILHQHGNIVFALCTNLVPAMVSQIIEDQVEVLGEQRPERVIKVDGKTVAMTQNEARTGRVTVLSQEGDCILVQSGFVHRDGLGNLPHSR